MTFLWIVVVEMEFILVEKEFWIVSLLLTDKKFFFLFENMDQENRIKFCVKNEIKYATTFEMLTVAFGESTMSRTQVQL